MSTIRNHRKNFESEDERLDRIGGRITLTVLLILIVGIQVVFWKYL